MKMVANREKESDNKPCLLTTVHEKDFPTPMPMEGLRILLLLPKKVYMYCLTFDIFKKYSKDPAKLLLTSKELWCTLQAYILPLTLVYKEFYTRINLRSSTKADHK